jgi:hypothetical protein
VLKNSAEVAFRDPVELERQSDYGEIGVTELGFDPKVGFPTFSTGRGIGQVGRITQTKNRKKKDATAVVATFALNDPYLTRPSAGGPGR